MRTGTRLLVALLLLTSWASCDRPTPVAPADSTLTITANPTRIAVNGTATITVLARKSDGRAVNEGTEINFSTNLGTIEPVVMTDARGIAEATLAGDNRIGMATVSADSGAAGTATIDVQIGALASFIDFTANPETIEKDLPPGGQKIKLKAIVRDDLNNVIRGIAVAFEADIGTLESGGSVTNLNGVARDTLTVRSVAGVTDGVFEIQARAAADEGSEISEIIEIRVTGFAANISLTVTPTSIPVTGGFVTLAALVRDDEGDAAVGENVNFFTDLGTLASGGGLVPTDDGGQAVDTLTITEADLAALPAGTTGITVSAEVAGSGGVLIESEPETILLQTDEPIAGFDFTVSGLTVTFINTSTGAPPLTYLWDFGDGGTSTSESPGNTYAVEGTYMVSLTVTNIGGSNTLTKDVVVVAEPDIEISPTSLAFGTVTVGNPEVRTFTISNVGSADLNIIAVSVSNNVFSVAPIASVLFPGESRSVNVTFTPTAAQSESGVLSITSDDPDPLEVTVSVTLSGTGQ